MKKSLVALAVLAAAGAASAQSSVTLFGIVDASVSHYSVRSSSTAAKQNQTVLANGGYNSSRLGFRGTEDLGGGLAAGFWLEAPLSNDDGSQTRGFNFTRRSTVSLSGGFGEIRLGRDYTPTFWNDTVFDPFGTNGVGTNVINSVHAGGAILTGLGGLADGNAVRASNTVGYFLPPNLGGFYGQVQYGLHENVKVGGADVSKAGQYIGGRVGYANGPLDVALAYGQNTQVDTAIAENKNKILNLGASYDLGVVKLFGEYSRIENSFDTAASNYEPKVDGALFGVTAPIGAGLIRASYSIARGDLDTAGLSDPKTQKLAIGYVHNLSKRTALYATYAYIKNTNGAAAIADGGSNSTLAQRVVGVPSANAQGYDFGIRHSF